MAAHATFERQRQVTEKVEADLASQRIQQRTVKKQLEVRTLSPHYSTLTQCTNNTLKLAGGQTSILRPCKPAAGRN